MGGKIVKAYEKIENIVMCLAMLIGIGIMFIGVIARYFFNHPLTVVDEIGPIFLVWSSIVGYSVALRKDEHIRMDILYDVIKSAKVKKIVLIFSYICGLIFMLFMTQSGYSTMMMQYRMNRVTQIMEFPLWIAYMIIPICGVVMVIRYVYMIIKATRNDKLS